MTENMQKRADLHIHTYYSDGTFLPDDVARIAKTNGVDLVAVTDHDDMLGCEQLKVACEKRGILAVRGIEISAYDGTLKVHTLGYGVDFTCEAYQTFFKKCVEGGLARAEEMVEKLNINGVKITLADVRKELVSAEQPIHAMHVARAGARKGYASAPVPFYLDWLNAGRPAHSNVMRPTPQEAIEVIHASGGFSSLAHPGRIALEHEEKVAMIRRLKEQGLDGIEACYSTHTSEETTFYKELAQELGLLVTGGSDTHTVGVNRKIGTPLFYPDAALLGRLGISET
jgi:hypothetical protein